MHRLFGVTVEPFLFVQSGIFCLTNVIVPQFLQDRVCQNRYNSTVCDTLSGNKKTPHEDDIQEVTSLWLAILRISTQIVMTFGTVFIGQLADTIGKRKSMILQSVLSLIQGIVLIILSKVSGILHPAWLFLPLLMYPLVGDIQGALLLSLAYKASVTNIDTRTREMARAEGFHFFAFAVVTLLSGIMLKCLSYAAVFAGSAVLSMISFMYVVLILPDEKVVTQQTEETDLIPDKGEQYDLSHDYSSESLPLKMQRDRSIFDLQRIRKVLTTKSEGHTVKNYLLLFGLAMFSSQGFFSISVLYFSHSPFNLRTDQLGYILTCYFGMAAMADWFTVPLLQKFAGFQDLELVISGFAASTVQLVLVATSKMAWIVYIYSVLSLFSVLPLSVIKSIMTKHVSDDLYGSVMTVAELIDSIASLATGFLCSFIYSKTVSIYPGTVLFVLAFNTLIAFCYSLVTRLWKQRSAFVDNIRQS